MLSTVSASQDSTTNIPMMKILSYFFNKEKQICYFVGDHSQDITFTNQYLQKYCYGQCK